LLQQDAESEVLLVYDKECPFCEFYCQLVQIESSLGRVRIVDARRDSEVMQRITATGLDIDQGMVLQVGEQLFYGADAIHALALMSSRSGFFNRINYWMFKSALLSRLIYPVLRFFRNLALKLMGKTRINNLDKPDNERF
jgi:predicted DCC family thiol-disulfide oxidoreductase YuxK